MVIGIFGESCVGKSTLANRLHQIIGGTLVSGKDYLRLAKNETIAKKLFQKKLENAKEEHIIYVLTEKELLSLLPAFAVRVRMTAELSVITERFAARMHGNLPDPVREMLKRKHGVFDDEPCDVWIKDGDDLDKACHLIVQKIEKKPDAR
ncbi:MAG: hypothetical protein J6D37_01310 [Clostridia bacterium]|nr:hypothetical protein [Clostridia bacterium]